MALPGLMMPPGLIAPSGAWAPHVSLRSSTSNAGSSTIAIPAGVVAGDILVFMQLRWREGTNDPGNLVVPEGWSTLASVAGTGGSDTRHVGIHYKIAAGNEGGTTITGMSAANAGAKIVLVFTGPFSAITPGSTFGVSPMNENNSQSITSADASAPVIALAAYASTTGSGGTRSVTPSDNSVVAQEEDAHLQGYYSIFNSSPSNVVCVWNGLVNSTLRNRGAWCGGYLALTP